MATSKVAASNILKPNLWRLWTAGKFPRPVKLSAARNVWRADEIDAWIGQRVAERDGGQA